MKRKLPVVLHKRVKVICVGVFVYVLAGSVDVGGHVSAATEWLVVHVVRLIFATSKTTVHTLRGKKAANSFMLTCSRNQMFVKG